ncbi:putative isopropanol dehydrogenase [Lojkania enalia]|uniref:Isopropanol dehydrogenase n=1 Tax=Lojkania enalia TaxID=147567 RepID=A0A9P4TQV4_9PLEO|nr:putative isopropanol dehydrogenase [Didymosphaeria enalia]
MSTYKALILESFDNLPEVKDLPTPTVTSGSVLVNPLYAVLQNYSRALFKGIFPVTLPLTPGNSSVARVEVVGPDAVTIKPGDIVWVDSLISGRDDPDTQMLTGMYGGGRLMDAWRHGHYGEKALIPLENVHVLPPSLFESKEKGGRGYSVKDFALIHLTLTAYGGLELAGVAPGKTVIVGPATGKFSGGAVLAALAMGAKVIGIGRDEVGLQNLYRFPGAKERLTTIKLARDVQKDTGAILSSTDGKGADVFIDFSPPAASGPETPPHISAAIGALRRNGQAVLMGGVNSNIVVNYTHLMHKNITVRGQFMYERRHVEQFIQMLVNGNVVIGEEVGLTIAGTFGLESLEEGLDLAEKGTKWGSDVLIAPNPET